MKNFDLNAYELSEMTFVETKETNGGLGLLATIVAGVVVVAVAAVIDDWDNFKAGLAGEKKIEKP